MAVEENKALVRGLIDDLWNRHDVGALERCVAPGLREETSQHVRQLLEGFPDVRVTVEDLFGEGDRVAARLTIRGTHTGPFAGRPPTGKRMSWDSIRIYRIADGRIVETWAMQDRLGLMQQLGLLSDADAEVDWAGGGSPGPDGR